VKAVTLCALCGQEAEVFTLHGMPITSCSCVSMRDGMVMVNASRASVDTSAKDTITHIIEAIHEAERLGARRREMVILVGMVAGAKIEAEMDGDRMRYGAPRTPSPGQLARDYPLLWKEMGSDIFTWWRGEIHGVPLLKEPNMPVDHWRVQRLPSIAHASVSREVADHLALFRDVPRETAPKLLSRAADVRAPLGDFSGERKLYATTMSDTPLGQRSEHVVSVVELRGHVPMTPTISDADRRKRARLAFERVKGTTPAVETWTCSACGSSNISPGCKACEAVMGADLEQRAAKYPTANQAAARYRGVDEYLEKQVVAPFVRSGVDPTERLVPMPTAMSDVALVANMQTDMRLADFVPPGQTRTPPTDEQRAAWSRALRAKQAESDRKERERVVVDLEWD
jgi:hypothetical protein